MDTPRAGAADGPGSPTGRRQGREYTDRLFANAMVESDFPPELLPLVVAHRGASATFPENTLESFEAAVEAGAQAVEFDVRLPADGQWLSAGRY